MRLSPIQIELLRVIKNGNPDGSDIDLDQLLEVISYRTTKASMQFSIRALIAKEVIAKGFDKRRDRRHVTYKITPLGKHFTADIFASVFVNEDSERLDSDSEPSR